MTTPRSRSLTARPARSASSGEQARDARVCRAAYIPGHLPQESASQSPSLTDSCGQMYADVALDTSRSANYYRSCGQGHKAVRGVAWSLHSLALPRGVQRTPLPTSRGVRCSRASRRARGDARALIDSVSTTDRRRRPGRLACSEAPVFLSVTAHARRAALIWWSTRLQGAGAGGSAHPVAEAWVEGTRTSGSGFGAICRPLTDWSQVVGGPTISRRPGLQPCLRLADLALDLENPVFAPGYFRSPAAGEPTSRATSAGV